MEGRMAWMAKGQALFNKKDIEKTDEQHIIASRPE